MSLQTICIGTHGCTQTRARAPTFFFPHFHNVSSLFHQITRHPHVRAYSYLPVRSPRPKADAAPQRRRGPPPGVLPPPSAGLPASSGCRSAISPSPRTLREPILCDWYIAITIIIRRAVSSLPGCCSWLPTGEETAGDRDGHGLFLLTFLQVFFFPSFFLLHAFIDLYTIELRSFF